MRDRNGKWSLVQVARDAGVTHRAARTIAAAGYLDPDNLTHHDVLILRVAAALLDAPRPAGENRNTAKTALADRNAEALRLTRQVLISPAKDAALTISPTSAVLHDNPFKLMGYLGDLTDAVLLLPVGIWALELDHTAPAQAAS